MFDVCRFLVVGCAAFLVVTSTNVLAEPAAFDLVAVARKARPAVMFLKVTRDSSAKIGTGTGFIVSTNGLMVTSWHVIRNATAIVAKDAGGHEYPVHRLIAEDAQSDLAILAVEGKDLPRVTLGSSESAEQGSRIALIGSPLGMDGTLSEGIISAVRPLFGQRMIQISNPMASGSSGSPVLNGDGEVIAVASGQVLGETEAQNIGFAVPVEVVRRLLANPLIEPRAFGESLAHQQTSINESKP